MISSFFNRTKPITFLVLLGFIMLLFWTVTFKLYGFQLGYGQLFERMVASGFLVLSVFLLGNMVKTKKLTSDNSFAVLFFSILLLTFFNVIKNTDIIFSNFFLLISWDRALALRNEKNQKEKIFESALWTLVASIFMEWAILYLISLYIAIPLFCGKQLRLWLMPVAAFLCFSILGITGTFLFGNIDFFTNHYRFSISSDFFLRPNYTIVLYIIFAFMIAFMVFGKLGYRRLGRTLSLRLLFAYLVTSFFILLFFGNRESGMEILSFFPMAIFLANYMETFKALKVKEIIILVCIVLPSIGFVMRLFQ